MTALHRSWVVVVTTMAVAFGSASVAGAGCSTAICTPSIGSCTISTSQTIDHGCTLDFSGRTVTIDRNVVLETAATGHSWAITAANLVVNGVVRARGGRLTVTTTDAFRTQTVSNSPGRIDVRDGGSLVVNASGAVELVGQDVNADGGATNGGGGTVSVTGASITTSATIHADGNPGPGGIIRLNSTSGPISVGGITSVNGSSNSDAADGGYLSVRAAGNLTVTHNLLASGSQNGSGGTIDLETGGAATLNGNYTANGVGGGSFANGGYIDVQAASATINANLTATGNAAASGGSVTARTTSGALSVSAGRTISVNGGGSAGGLAGFVELHGATTVTVAGTVTASAGGPDSAGGEVLVQAPGTVTVSGVIDARSTSTSGLRDGRIQIGPACDVVVSGTVKSRDASGGGTNTFHYHRAFNASGSTLRADNVADGSGGNQVVCGCADANTDGLCDAPEACAQQPVVTGATLLPVLATAQPALPVACN